MTRKIFGAALLIVVLLEAAAVAALMILRVPAPKYVPKVERSLRAVLRDAEPVAEPEPVPESAAAEEDTEGC